MSNRIDLGKMYPGKHPSGRIWQPPVSVAQARARVIDAMGFLQRNCHDGIDVGYAIQIFDEVAADFMEITTTGTIDMERNAKLELQTKELLAECAELQAEAVVLQAMRDLDGEAGQS